MVIREDNFAPNGLFNILQKFFATLAVLKIRGNITRIASQPMSLPNYLFLMSKPCQVSGRRKWVCFLLSHIAMKMVLGQGYSSNGLKCPPQLCSDAYFCKLWHEIQKMSIHLLVCFFVCLFNVFNEAPPPRPCSPTLQHFPVSPEACYVITKVHDESL